LKFSIAPSPALSEGLKNDNFNLGFGPLWLSPLWYQGCYKIGMQAKLPSDGSFSYYMLTD
jgi:hypothetical protein